jgi:hypothetical protein
MMISSRNAVIDGGAAFVGLRFASAHTDSWPSIPIAVQKMAAPCAQTVYHRKFILTKPFALIDT